MVVIAENPVTSVRVGVPPMRATLEVREASSLLCLPWVTLLAENPPLRLPLMQFKTKTNLPALPVLSDILTQRVVTGS